MILSTNKGMDVMESDQAVRRHRCIEEPKQQVPSECERPNASVANVAMAHSMPT